MFKKLGKKKEIMLIVLIFLLLLTGIGGFLFMRMSRNTDVEDEIVLTSDWDISWYDENKDEFVLTTKEELLGFADISQVLDFKGKTIKLGNDIVINEGNAQDWKTSVPAISWVPILKFAGTFDGQGHTISGLYACVTRGGAGMFADAQEKSVIRDFKLLNSYIFSQSSKGTGTIASSTEGKIEYIYTDAILTCNGFYCGGIVGHLKDKALVNQCWYDGALTINGGCAGGIAGSAGNGHSKMTHCLNTAAVTSTYPGPDPAVIGGILGAATKNIDISDTLNVGTVVSEAGLEQVGGLIGMISGGTVKIDALWTASDIAPDRVGYAKSGFDGPYGFCRLDQMIGVKAYQKMNLDYEKNWAIVEGGTPVLQYFAETVPEIPEGLERAIFADTSWFNIKYTNFEISTPEQLLGLGVLTEMGEGYGNRFTNKKIILKNDIVFNTGKAANWEKEEPLNEWLPVYNFTGTIDGEGHTISGLYAIGSETAKTGTGFFAYGRETTVIENLKITNSYFETKNIYGLAAVVGRGGGTIRNVYADAILKNTVQGNIGGMFGFATRSPVSIENCWSDCDITSGGRRVGGILGNGNGRQEVEIKHCLNTGNLTRSFKDVPADNSNRRVSSLFGGIAGGTGNGKKDATTGVYKYTGEFLIEDCFNAGLITSEREADGKTNDGTGGIAGLATGKTSEGETTVTVKNCYCTETSAKRAIGDQKADAVVLGIGRLPDKMVIGADAYFYTGLNFKQYWTALDGKTPVLKTFAAGKGKALAVSGERVDTSWYKAGKTEYTIKTKAELYGFMALSAGGDKFQNKTIKLGADIVVNEGNAADWAVGKGVPTRQWEPIYNLLGSFDGQGHTISGLYSSLTGPHADRAGVGMFSHTRTACTIKNLTLRNSCFKSTYANGVAAISARGSGTFKNIHVGSDVYLANPICGNVGGILGISTQTDTDKKTNESTTYTTIENCWSEAKITVAGQGVGGIVGNGNAQKVTIKNCLHSGTMTRSFAELDATLKLYDYAVNKGTYSDSRKSAGYWGGIIGRTGGGKKDATTGITAYTGKIVVENCVHVGTVTSERENDAVGGIVGHVIGLDKNKKPALTVTNAYCTTSSCQKVNGSNNADAAISNCLMLNDDKLKGLEAFYNTNLDFNKYWSARKSTTPMLTYFLTSADAVESVAGLSKQQFTLVDNKGYIANANQLAAFRNNLNDGTIKVNSDTVITLTADIVLNEGDAKEWAEGKNLPEEAWTPITGFTGIFDGGGHTISGLYVVTAGGIEGTGLFTKLAGGTIQNLVIQNSYIKGTTTAGTGALVGCGHGTIKNIAVNAMFASAQRKTGGIIGCVNGATTISNCWNAGDIATAQYEVGGILGGMAAAVNDNANTITIEYCLNTGDITTTKASGNAFMGGIAGMGNASSNGGAGRLIVNNCMNAGVVNGTVTGRMGAIVGNDGAKTSCVTLTNCVAVIQYNQDGTVIGMTNKHIGYDPLNASKTDCVAVDLDKALGDLATTNTTLDFTTYWTTREKDVPVLTIFKDIASTFDPNSGSGSEDVNPDDGSGSEDTTTISIGTAAELISFANGVNDGSVAPDSKVKLTADINLNEGWTASATAPTNVWTPITGFAGTFDGDGHTISGMYVATVSGIAGTGMFTGLNGGTIQNLVIQNSYIKGTTTAGTGALVGCGHGTIKNVAVNVIFASAPRKTGGILGLANGATIISNCWNASDITSTQYELGGILGGMAAAVNDNANTITIEYCLNTGDITTTKASGNTFTGGIAGMGNASSNGGAGRLIVNNCMNAGIVNGTVTGRMGAIVGNDGAKTSCVTLTNCVAVIQYNQDETVIGMTDKYIGYDALNAPKTDCVAVSIDNVKGADAILNTKLDLVVEGKEGGKWSARQDNIPMLTCFLTASDIVVNSASGKLPTIYIGTLDELISFANGVNDGSVSPSSKVELTADIVVNPGNAAEWADKNNAPAPWIAINGFQGTFDGAGHTISGLYVYSKGSGLFTSLSGATVQNLRITNSFYKPYSSTTGTGVITDQGYGTFKNIYTNVIIKDTDKKGSIGGIIGKASGDCLFSECWTANTIESNNLYVGGIMGNVTKSGLNITIEHCLNSGNLTFTYTGTEAKKNSYFGGFVGRANTSSPTGGVLTMNDCLNTGLVSGTQYETYMGGLIGHGTLAASGNETTVVTNSYCAKYATGATKGVGYDQRTNKTGATAVSNEKLLGELALANAGNLDFVTDVNPTGKWNTRVNDYPILARFLSLVQSLSM